MIEFNQLKAVLDMKTLPTHNEIALAIGYNETI
jgi:hypothetical protein